MDTMDQVASQDGEGLQALVRRAFLARQGPFRARRGAVAALTVGVPMLAGAVGGDSRAGFLIGFGALQGMLIDGAFPYRRRTIIHVVSTIGTAAALMLGTVAGNQPAGAVLFLVLLTGATAFSGAFGTQYEPLGLVIPVAGLFGTAVPGPLPSALHQGAWVLLGGAWATAVCVFGWAWRQDHSVDNAAAAVLGAASQAMEDVATTMAEHAAGRSVGVGHGPVIRDWPEQGRADLRARLAELADTTNAAYGPTAPQGVRFRLLALGVERLAVRAAALTESVETIATARGELPTALIRAIGGWAAAAAATYQVASDQAVASARPAPLQETEARRAAALAAVSSVVAEWSATAPELAADRADHIVATADLGTAADFGVVQHAVDRVDDAITLGIAALTGDATAPRRPGIGPATSWRSRVTATLSPHLALSAPRCRLAIRLALAVAIGESVVQAASLDHGIWLVLTLLVILRTDRSSTWTRAVQRVGGTIVGSVLAAVLLQVLGGQRLPVGSHLIILVLVFMVLVGLAMPLISVNYGYFVVALTPLALVMSDLSGPSSWRTAATRAALTVAGGALAIVADAVVLPVRESHRLPAQMAGVIERTGAYLDAVLSGHVRGRVDVARITLARRSVEQVAASAIDTTVQLHGSGRADRRAAAAAGPVLEACLELMASVRAAGVDAVAMVPGTSPDPDELPLRQVTAALRPSIAQWIAASAARVARLDLEHAPLTGPVLYEGPRHLLPTLAQLDAGLVRLSQDRSTEIIGGKATNDPAPGRGALERWHNVLRFLHRVEDRMSRLEVALDRVGADVAPTAGA